ncbi:MAG: deoxyribodipyrimidine photo-lyase [Paraglaciecola sp.]|jgi:deoxyribodipyrimidine photo-lyase
MSTLSKAKSSRGIFWFRHDLRLADNNALAALSELVDELVCIFIVDPRWFKPSHFQAKHMGQARWAFLQETLSCLDKELASKGQRLFVFEGEPVTIFDYLIARLAPQFISVNQHPGVYERQQWQRIKDRYPHISFSQSDAHFLLTQDALPFTLDCLPDGFTSFRKRVEEMPVSPPCPVPVSIAKPIDINLASFSNKFDRPSAQPVEFQGGAKAGLKQLHWYLFETHNIKAYKKTRNGLDGWDYSSKLSAWLANGSLSARQVYSQLKDYEAQHGSNDSTYWLYFELLWRDYFQWYLLKHQSRLFQFSGVRNRRPLTTFLPQRFARWCQGETPYPIVNACMKQLNQTGYMSNRGRQLVASCLVHEMGVDWRFGAAYFEQQLVDFDVASNWGNWQYLAGVGADPRGHRRFNLDKQTASYDPNGHFIVRWGGQVNESPLDQTDAADWPIG